jgi:hypothetical protein
MPVTTNNVYGLQNATGVAINTVTLQASTGVNFPEGTFVCTSSGLAVPAADTTNLIAYGVVALSTSTVSGGASTVTVYPFVNNPFQNALFVSPSTNILNALVYFADNQTVASTTTNSILAGRVLQIVTTGATGIVTIDTADGGRRASASTTI